MPMDWDLERGGEGGSFVSSARAARSTEAAAFAALHAATDAVARPAMEALVARRAADGRGCQADGITEPPIAGCVLSVPTASAQAWHSDGHPPLPGGIFNVFVPLVSLTRSNGPTELRPGTHHHEDGTAHGLVAERQAPLLEAGDVLIFDYRTRCERSSEAPTLSGGAPSLLAATLLLPCLMSSELLIYCSCVSPMDNDCHRHRGLANNSSEPRPVAYVSYAIGGAKDANFPAAATLAWD